MKSSIFNNKSNLILCALAFLAAGCGKSSSAPAVETVAAPSGSTSQSTCAPGMTVINGICAPNPCPIGYDYSGGSCVASSGGDVFTNCASRGGTAIVSNGQSLCKVSSAVNYRNLALNPYPYIYQLATPRLNETANSTEAETGVVLLAGDQVSFAGTGLYGTTSTSYSSCDTPFEGKSSAGLKGSFRAGALLAKIGAGETWQLLNGSVHTVGTAGPLRVGFNLDTGSSGNLGCFQFYQWDLRVSRCYNASGNAYPCPSI